MVFCKKGNLKMKKAVKFVSVLLAGIMILSMAGCDSLTSSKKKSKKDKDDDEKEEEVLSEKDAINAAEEVTKALLKFDGEKAISLCDKVSDSTKDRVTYTNYYEDAKNVYNAWLDTFEYEIDEDDVEVDDDEATVPVTISYISIDRLQTDSCTEDQWIDAINNAKADSTLELEMEFSYDEDEEEIFLTNGDEVICDFYDAIDMYIYVNTFVYYDNAVFGSWTKDSYSDTDTLQFDYTFADIPELDGKSVNIYVVDPDYYDIYSNYIDFKSGASDTITITPKDQGVDAFTGGSYYVEFFIGDDNAYFCSYTYVEVSLIPTPTGTDFDGEIHLLAPDPDAVGTFDDSSNTYTNKYFGFQYTLPDGMAQAPATYADLSSIEELKDAEVDFFAMGDDYSMAFHIIGKIDVLEGASDEFVEMFVEALVGSDVGLSDSKSVKYGNVTFVQCNDSGVDFYITFKGDNVFFLCFMGGGDITFDDYVSAMKGI